MQDCGHTPEGSGPIVERVMRNGKKLDSSAFKTWIVEQALKSGVSVSSLAMRHGINANQLRRWMRLRHWREASALTAPVVLALTIAEPAVTSSSSAAAAATSSRSRGSTARVWCCSPGGWSAVASCGRR